MTREEVKRMLPVLQAFAEGKTIQIRQEGSAWLSWLGDELRLTGKPENYRVKPEAREFWIVYWKDGTTNVYTRQQPSAGEHVKEIIHVKEVISE